MDSDWNILDLPPRDGATARDEPASVVVPVDQALSFDDLLMRIHPAETRVRKLAATNTERKALVPRLEKLIGPPGFTGQAPGGPSRWSNARSAEWEPLKPKLIVEVRYDHFSGGRFRHGTKFLRWRPDKAPQQCTLDQVEPEGVSSLALLGGRRKSPKTKRTGDISGPRSSKRAGARRS